jgi:putative transposase
MYPTNLTDSQYKVMDNILNDKRKRKYPLRNILNALLYVSKGGIQWRLLPKEFPAWQLTYYYFRKWLLNGMWDTIQNALRELLRVKHGKKSCPSLGIIDSQSVKNSEWGLPDKGYDGNKKVNGRKRHIVVDTLGLLLCILVTPANVHDCKAAEEVIMKMQGRFPRLRRILADGGYLGEQLIRLARSCLNATWKVVTRKDESSFKVIPKRWIVERSIAWFNWYRRLSKDYEANMSSSEAWVQIASISMMIRKF